MKLDAQTIAILAASELEGDKLRLPAGKLKRPVYLAVNKALEAMGGEWNRKEKAHVFSVDPTSALELAIETSEVTRPQEYGFFETPEPLVERMLDLARVSLAPPEFHGDWMDVLEPSAGRGRIVKAALRRGARVMAYELLPENARHSEANVADFLSVNPDRHDKADAIVMNPPFSRQEDIRHVMHAFRFLRAKGSLVSVMSAGVMFRDNRLTKAFRDHIERLGGTIEPLPPLTFRESGTDVNTCLVVVRT